MESVKKTGAPRLFTETYDYSLAWGQAISVEMNFKSPPAASPTLMGEKNHLGIGIKGMSLIPIRRRG